jgi:RND family efflux transporter MFP subunit
VAFLARDGSPVKAGEAVVLFDPYDAEKAAADSKGDLRAAESRRQKSRAELGKAEQGLKADRTLAADEVDRAQSFVLQDETVFSRYEIIESSLDKALAQSRADAIARKLETSSRVSETELALRRIEAGMADLTLRQAQKTLSSLRVEAPHDGLLILSRNWRAETIQVGDTLWPGQKVAEIPDLKSLEARVHVLEADAAGLAAGQKATVAIEGRPGQSFGATVSRVEVMSKPRERESPVKYFEAILTLERTETEFMRPGQKVTAEIRLEEAGDVIAIPRGAVFEKDGRRVVFKRKDGRFEAVEVAVGRHSVSRVVVEKGLAAGDTIALRDPSLGVSRIFGGAEKAARNGAVPR